MLKIKAVYCFEILTGNKLVKLVVYGIETSWNMNIYDWNMNNYCWNVNIYDRNGEIGILI